MSGYEPATNSPPVLPVRGKRRGTTHPIGRAEGLSYDSPGYNIVGFQPEIVIAPHSPLSLCPRGLLEFAADVARVGVGEVGSLYHQVMGDALRLARR